MNDVPVAEKHLFAPPGKGVFFVFPVKTAVGQAFQFFTGEAGNTVFMDFGNRRERRFPVERAAFLTFIAAEDKGSFFEDFYFHIRQVFLFLGNAGFAAGWPEGLPANDFPGAGSFTETAVSAGKGKRLIRLQFQGGQDGADGDKGTVKGMDQAVIFPEESETCRPGEPPVHHGGSIGEGIKSGFRKFLLNGLNDFFHVPVIDDVIILWPCIEGDIGLTFLFGLIGEKKDEERGGPGKEIFRVKPFFRIRRGKGDGACLFQFFFQERRKEGRRCSTGMEAQVMGGFDQKLFCLAHGISFQKNCEK